MVQAMIIMNNTHSFPLYQEYLALTNMESEDNRTNLIINYLPQSLTDLEFHNFFSTIGSLKSAKIIRHKNSGYSYGFGFVEYVNPRDALRAIETLNGTQLQAKKIKVAFARPGGDNIKNANLYIRGIPKSMSEEDVERLFAQCGKIIQCRLLKDELTGLRKGVGFVLFDLKEQAELAIEKFNGQTLAGSLEPLSIKIAEDNKKIKTVSSNYTQFISSPFRGTAATLAGGPIRQLGYQRNLRYNPLVSYGGNGVTAPPTTGDTSSGHTLFVYNIGVECDEKSLWHLFGQYGSILKVNVIRDGSTGQGKGYGFVTMANYDDAVWAIEALNGFPYAGKPLQVSFKSQK
ncbi:ELAVL1 [Cordylochernes scorpioides]|uniref:ELAVL1 n=1 Tax=Cordylochernes scorpioides TaxID=51811 RepID=A0ABY6LGU3_9ARAC|nr:ELAVL1 [Cordylochernes scorpioides]